MNNKKINALIDFYIQNEKRIHFNKREGYKWQILLSIRDEIIAYTKRHYKNGVWDQDYSDFHEFTRKTIGKTGNLVYSSSRSVMQKAADKYPEQVRNMFIDLSGLYSNASLKDRVCDFIRFMNRIAEENPDISKSGKSFHKDFRSVSVYLLMMDPSRNYNYMYSTFARFAKFVDLELPKEGDVQLLLDYYSVCDEIGQILRDDYKGWFDNYLDKQRNNDEGNEGRTDVDGHLLVQDIVFSLYYYYHPESLVEDSDTIVYPTKFKRKPKRKTIMPGNGVFVDYEKQHKKNIVIGNATEAFVVENERKLVAEYGFDTSRVVHVSKEQGDNLGYDILSCDRNGKDIFIEVKGTRGGIGTAFYITENELQCSILHSDKYRLYRVYDFSLAGASGVGKIAVIEGSLEPYCVNPVSYRAVF